MTVEQSRRLGQVLMAISAVQVFLFLFGAARRSYLVVALPAAGVVAAVSGLAFWVGYTMATMQWDDPADFGVTPSRDGAAVDERAEGAPPPDALG